MKKLFFLWVLGLAMIVGCQPPAPAPVPDSVFEAASIPVSVVRTAFDTIQTTSSTDAFTLDLGTYSSPAEFDIQIQADSVSGGTTGTAVLQWSALTTGSRWYNVASGSTTINGVTTTDRKTGVIVGGRLRLSVTAGSSTQNTRVFADIRTCPREPN